MHGTHGSDTGVDANLTPFKSQIKLIYLFNFCLRYFFSISSLANLDEIELKEKIENGKRLLALCEEKNNNTVLISRMGFIDVTNN